MEKSKEVIVLDRGQYKYYIIQNNEAVAFFYGSEKQEALDCLSDMAQDDPTESFAMATVTDVVVMEATIYGVE